MNKYKVYCLRDKDNQIKYVGQTRQTLERRFNGHQMLAREGRYPTTEFTIELIADFDRPEPMYKLEAMLIEQYKLLTEGWNKSEGYNECPEQFDSSGEKNGFYGHKHRQEICDRIGQRSLGNSYAKGNKSRAGLKNSEFHNQRIGETHQKKVMCLETGEVFKSGREAARKLGLQRSKISNVCLGKRKTTGGYHFIFVE